MNTTAALRLARALLDEHGLRDWRVALDRAKTRAGVTVFGTRTISLSAPLTRVHTEDEVRQTILHEIAHALVGPVHGHDEVWKAKARELGTSDARCLAASGATRELAPFIGICSQGHEVRRHRRPTRLVSCTLCAPRFDPAHLFEWTYRGHHFSHHPEYARALADAELRASGGPARPPVRRLAMGEAARIVAEGKFQDRTGTIEGVGRTRYQVRVEEGILSVPFSLIEPA